MQESVMPSLYLCLEAHCLPSFISILQSGFRLKTKVGLSIETMLCQEYGVQAETLDKIQTIFLDGKAVDDLESSVVRDGSILALSAAMPGLVGATLRRGGYYAAMRSPITSTGTRDTPELKEGMVTLKLFNLLLKELGPIFLRRGIWIEKSELQAFLSGLSGDFWMRCKEVRMNGRKVEPETVSKMVWPDADEFVFLKVELSSPDAHDCVG
jgi:hypothetical protein